MQRVCYPVPVMSLQASVFHSNVYGPWEYFPPPSPCPTVPFLTSWASEPCRMWCLLGPCGVTPPPGERYCLDFFLWSPSIIQTQLRMDCPCVGLGSKDLTAEGLQCALWPALRRPQGNLGFDPLTALGGDLPWVCWNVGGACFWDVPPGSGRCSKQILAVSSISLWQNKYL